MHAVVADKIHGLLCAEKSLMLQGFLVVLAFYFAALCVVMINVFRSSMAITAECIKVRLLLSCLPTVPSLPAINLSFTEQDSSALACCSLPCKTCAFPAILFYEALALPCPALSCPAVPCPALAALAVPSHDQRTMFLCSALP